MHGSTDDRPCAAERCGDRSTGRRSLLGPDPSVGGCGESIAERAAGNPFFAEEIVRELAERGVLRGEPGAYVATAESAEVTVPATLQATIAARIDRLDPKAKRTLSAAAVVGSRFGLDLLTVLGTEPTLDELVKAELIDQVRSTPPAEYAFRHPLIRTVAYESQLKSDRAELHRRVAAAIESRALAAVDENAALIAEHLEAAGDLRRRLRLAHARRNLGDQPRHRRGAIELGARPNDRRRPTGRGPRPGSHAHRPAHHVVRDRLASPSECGRRPL